MTAPLVSVITPTYGRAVFLERLVRFVKAQTHTALEWRILDDSPAPNAFLRGLNDDNIHYTHSPERLSIGEKRNRLIDAARGEIIVHFDDDDYYAPDYIATMLSRMTRDGSDFVRLSGFFVLHLEFMQVGYYRIFHKQGPAFAFKSGSIEVIRLDELNIPWIHLNYGWTYMYRRAVWESEPFKDINTFEDREFILAAREKFQIRHFEDVDGMSCHSVHAHSSSNCFPQFRIPLFVARKLDPGFAAYLDAAAAAVQREAVQ